jgi:hypothetical protein
MTRLRLATKQVPIKFNELQRFALGSILGCVLKLFSRVLQHLRSP